VTWTDRFTPTAQRQADNLDPPVRERVTSALTRLALDPHRAANVKALRGSSRYRLRVGDWHVIYTLENNVLVVLVVRVGHRREVYD
jgi:mRNA interferase RelE/StbE